MKKKLLIISLSVVTILFAAVYSIAQVDKQGAESGGVYGKCLDNNGQICVAFCPGCGEKYGPLDETYSKSGEGILTRGECSTCSYKFDDNR